jgi:hypothetical protein
VQRDLKNSRGIEFHPFVPMAALWEYLWVSNGCNATSSDTNIGRMYRNNTGIDGEEADLHE